MNAWTMIRAGHRLRATFAVTAIGVASIGNCLAQKQFYHTAEEPLEASEAAQTMRVPEGFRVTLFAGEPDVKQPIGFCIDDRGRLWVAEAYNYPHHGTTPGDRIVILEDADGEQAVLISTDLLGFPAGLSNQIRDQLEKKFELSRARILLNSTHTHSAPVLKDALYDIYPLDQKQVRAIERYSGRLADQLPGLYRKTVLRFLFIGRLKLRSMVQAVNHFKQFGSNFFVRSSLEVSINSLPGLAHCRQQLGLDSAQIDVIIIAQLIAAAGQFQQFLRPFLLFAVKAV